jgi:hypothetical protein
MAHSPADSLACGGPFGPGRRLDRLRNGRSKRSSRIPACRQSLRSGPLEMKKGLGVLTAVIASGLAAAIVVFFLAQNRSTPMSWLRAEFSLNEQQARKVEEIHAEYEADCALMCARIAQTDERLAKLICSSQTILRKFRKPLLRATGFARSAGRKCSSTSTGLPVSFPRRGSVNTLQSFFPPCCIRVRWRSLICARVIHVRPT